MNKSIILIDYSSFIDKESNKLINEFVKEIKEKNVEVYGLIKKINKDRKTIIPKEIKGIIKYNNKLLLREHKRFVDNVKVMTQYQNPRNYILITSNSILSSVFDAYSFEVYYTYVSNHTDIVIFEKNGIKELTLSK